MIHDAKINIFSSPANGFSLIMVGKNLISEEEVAYG